MYNVNSHTSMLDGFYLTTQYRGECGHIEGHAYSVLFRPKVLLTGHDRWAIQQCIHALESQARNLKYILCPAPPYV